MLGNRSTELYQTVKKKLRNAHLKKPELTPKVTSILIKNGIPTSPGITTMYNAQFLSNIVAKYRYYNSLVSIFQSLGVSNGPIQFKSARKIWPVLELLAKITRVLALAKFLQVLGFSLILLC